MLAEKIQNIRLEFEKDIPSVNDKNNLEDIRIKYLSRNGLISTLFDELKNVPREDKPVVGKELNSLREYVTGKFNTLKENFEKDQEGEKKLVDLSLPGEILKYGSTHILTQTLEEIKSIFKGLGFSVYEGPELESDYYNFEALNFPA
jgi:phenylalanyl-tRNA synthetase alpha chain